MPRRTKLSTLIVDLLTDPGKALVRTIPRALRSRYPELSTVADVAESLALKSAGTMRLDSRAQTEFLNSLKHRGYGIYPVVGMQGSGKCVEEGTLLTDAETGERFPVERLVHGTALQRQLTFGDTQKRPTTKLLSMDQRLKIVPSEIIGSVDMGVQPCMQLKTRLGHIITGTLEHPVYTPKGWKRLDQIILGDKIAVARRVPIEGTQNLDDNIVKILGYLMGDGGTTNTSPDFTNADPAVIEDLRQAAEATGHQLTFAADAGKAKTYRIIGRRPGHSNIKTLIMQYGLNVPSREKTVPSMIFTAPNRQVALFLNRLFACDGYVEQDDIAITLASRSMLEDVQHLLLRLDIVAGIRDRTVKLDGKAFRAYVLTISGRQAIYNFALNVGIFQKEDKVQALLQHITEKDSVNANYDTIPTEFNDYIREARDRSHAAISTLWVPDRLYAENRHRMAQIAELTQSDVLQMLATSDLYWDEVTFCQLAGDRHVYDIGMTEGNFLANDVVVHNTVFSLWLARLIDNPHNFTLGMPAYQVPKDFNLLQNIQDITRLPERSTVILDDAAQLTSLYQSYTKATGQAVIDMVALCRHLKLTVIVTVQNTSMVNRHLFDTLEVFFWKTPSLLSGFERREVRELIPEIQRVFRSNTEAWQRRHVFVWSDRYIGLMSYNAENVL